MRHGCAIPCRTLSSSVALVALLAALGCGEGQRDESAENLPGVEEAAAESPGQTLAPDWQRLDSATVSGIYEQPITLRDGVYEGESFVEGGASHPTVRLHEHATVLGDLDGDGSDEAMALLSESSGGSGSFLHLAVFRWGADGPENVETVRIGDRVQVRKMEFLVDKYVLETVEAGPGEPMCCPSHKRGRIVMLRDGELGVTVEELGIVSTRDVEGFPWEVTHLEAEWLVPDRVKIDVTFVSGELSGSAGCNKFGASYENDARTLTLGPVRLTRMSCTEELMRLENAFLGRLEAVEAFSFDFGRLLLNYRLDGQERSLICEPRGSNR